MVYNCHEVWLVLATDFHTAILKHFMESNDLLDKFNMFEKSVMSMFYKIYKLNELHF